MKFGVCFFHFFRGCSLWRNFFLHLFQNSSAMCRTLRHRFLKYKPGGINSPGDGMTTLDFNGRRLLGDIESTSFRVPTVGGLEFTTNSTSFIKVLINSSFKEKLRVRRSRSNMFLVIPVWHFQIPKHHPYVMLLVGYSARQSNLPRFLARSSWFSRDWFPLGNAKTTLRIWKFDEKLSLESKTK